MNNILVLLHSSSKNMCIYLNAILFKYYELNHKNVKQLYRSGKKFLIDNSQKKPG